MLSLIEQSIQFKFKVESANSKQLSLIELLLLGKRIYLVVLGNPLIKGRVSELIIIGR